MSLLNPDSVIPCGICLSLSPNEKEDLPRVALEVHRRKGELHSLGSSCAKQHVVAQLNSQSNNEFSNCQKAPNVAPLLLFMLASLESHVGLISNFDLT